MAAAPGVDFSKRDTDDAPPPRAPVLAQARLERLEVEQAELSLCVGRRSTLNHAPPPEPSERCSLAHARMGVDNKDVDLDAAHPVLGDAPPLDALPGFDRRDGKVSTERESEDVGRRRASRERVLGERRRGEREEREEVRERAGFDRDRERGFLCVREHSFESSFPLVVTERGKTDGPVDLDAGVVRADELVCELRGGRDASDDESEAARACLSGHQAGHNVLEEVGGRRCPGRPSSVQQGESMNGLGAHLGALSHGQATRCRSF